MNQEKFKSSLERYLTGEITPEERDLFFENIKKPEYEAILGDIITNDLKAHAYEEDEIQDVHSRILSSLDQYIQNNKVKSTKQPEVLEMKHGKVLHLGRKLAAAAAVIILLVATAYFVFYHTSSNLVNEKGLAFQNLNSESIIPGGNKAVLTLSNGTNIILDSAHNGQLAKQGNSKVVKVDSGLLSYSKQREVSSKQVVILYNKLSTPIGGQYKLILSDGTKVWLNAASSIRYPTAFVGKNREVEITGEAYFEVAKNPSQPFTVYYSSPDGGGRKGAVQVLGTHFNVNAYNDENEIKVTLLEGSVRISKFNIDNQQPTAYNSKRLKPGEQAILRQAQDIEGEITIIKNADVSEAVAWKNGLFQFDGIDIHEIMRQIARWYDVKLEYSGVVSQQFYGNMPRSAGIAEVLKMLETTEGVKFNIKGNKIIVMPY